MKAVSVSTLLLAAALVSTPALAEEATNAWYLGLGAGFAIPDDMDVSNLINPAANENLSLDNGWALVGALGYDYGQAFRAELEVGYRTFDADRLTDGTKVFGPFNMDGSVDVWNLGLNGFYDFELGGAITPYVGLGAGAAHLSADVQRSGGGALNKWNGDDWGFYYQGIVGASYDVSPQHRLFVEYRYFSTSGVDADSNNGAFTPDTNDDQLSSHNIMAGFRFSF